MAIIKLIIIQIRFFYKTKIILLISIIKKLVFFFNILNVLTFFRLFNRII